MSELVRETVTTAGTTTWGGLRVVPDPAVPLDHDARPLGEGVLGEEADLDQDVVLRHRVVVTHDVVTLVLQPTVAPEEQPVAFAPGQYLTLGVDLDGRRVERCYTIASPPTRPHLLAITVKRVPGGEVSTWLHDEARPGDRLHVRGPLGGFTVRNHDELTLEMVSEEYRQAMYGWYAYDPRMRSNVGIRRRLASLLDNSRAELELANALLLSLPGSPFLYYGDEIGMGDNIWLDDRDASRTPMQWTPDRNAGFSTADPGKLFLPPVQSLVYHYTSVNVEAQMAQALWKLLTALPILDRYCSLPNKLAEGIST